MKNFLRSCWLLLLVVNASVVSAQTSWKGTLNTNWAVAANWTNGIPDVNKDAVLGDANFTGPYQPWVNNVANCRSITIGGIVPTTLLISKPLNVAGSMTILGNAVVSHAATTVVVGGSITNNGVFNATTITTKLILTGANVTIGGTSVTTFRKLTINPGCNVHLAASIRVDGASSFLAVYGSVDPGQGTTFGIASTGITRLYDQGILRVYAANFSSNYDFTGAVTLYAGSIVDYGSVTTDQVISAAYSYSTLTINGTGTKSLAANLPPLYGKSAPYGKIIVNSGTFDLGSFSATRTYTRGRPGGEFTLSGTARLKISGLNNFPANFATVSLATASIVEYNGADQTVAGQVYGNLLFSTPGIKTATTAFTVAGNLNINNGTLNTNAVIVNHNVAGNFIMTGGALTGINGTYTLNGNTNQTISIVGAIQKLNINNQVGNILLASDITIANTLNFTHGIIQTDAFKVRLGNAATVTGAGASSGWVKGNLLKNIGTGATITKTFEVGDLDYTPATLNFSAVSTAGNLTVSARTIDHNEVVYSGIDPAKTVNCFWSMTNEGILFGNASATLNWLPINVDAGASMSNFKSATFNSGNWTVNNSVTNLSNAILVNNIHSFGDLITGEKIGRFTWNGNALTDNWFTAKNWLGGVPDNSVPTLVPGSITAGNLFPVISGSTAVVGDLDVQANASLTVSNARLNIKGNLVSNGNLFALAGTIEYSGTNPQTIAVGSFAGNSVGSLDINNDVVLQGVCKIVGSVSVSAGKTFSTNNYLVIKSDSTGTGRVNSLPVDAAGNATAYITGNVAIERYIPARKAWRLLSAPINPVSATTIVDAWQEGAYMPNSFAPNPNPSPGFGVHITGGTPENGFDQSPTNSPSVKVYDHSNNYFTGLPTVPGTFTPINSYQGYLVYIRGDRSIDLALGNNAPVTSTTLRIKGQLNTGNQVVNVNATNFTVLGNPYASAINFSTLTRNNVKNSFYIWDPKLAGSNGLGAYVTVSWNSNTSTYDMTTAASPISQYIPSGEAILVESGDGINPGSVTIKESDKTNQGSDFVFGRIQAASQQLRVNLRAINGDGINGLVDGALSTFSENDVNGLDADDITKFSTGGEGISFARNGRLLAIERRKTVTQNDTAFLGISKLKQQSYQLEIIAENLSIPGFTAWLKDNYIKGTNSRSIDPSGTTLVDFTVNNDPASYAADRFSIIFSKNGMPGLFVNEKPSTVPVVRSVPALSVYPNPVREGFATIRVEDLEKGKYTIEVINQNGQRVSTTSLVHRGGALDQKLSLDHLLPAGKYDVRIISEKNRTSFKASLIKEK